MDPGHRASRQHSLTAQPPNKFPHRITTTSLNSIGTRLPRYSVLGSQQSISDHDDELYADGETVDPRSTTDDGITASPVEDVAPQNRLSARASVASASPPRYSFAPPRYSSVFGVSAQQVMTEGVSRTEHTYNICSGLKNKPWVTFRVFSQPSLGASSRHQDSRFSSGDMVAGLIEFTLDSPQTINSITVSLHGRVIKGYLAEESDTFLDHQVSIWTRADGDPHFPDQGSTKKFSGRLNGAYQFPFAFPFPTLVDISTSTAFPPPFQTLQDPVGTSSNSSPTDATVSPTRSSSLRPATTPPTSRFRSHSIPANATFFSGSKKAPPMQMSTNDQFNDTHTNDVSTAYSMRDAGRRKNSMNQDGPRNQVNSYSMPSSPQGSDSKARLKRAVEEQDRILAQLGGSISNRLPVHVYPTPQTFLERSIRANVQYELGLHIEHGMLRPASKMKTAVIYTPSIIPPPASVARQRAYIQDSPLPGPAADPDGWQTLPKVMVYGKLPRRPEVEVECTLSLAKPLCYTRGTVIPCYLTLECLDVHALGLLSTPKSPVVRLTRRVRYTQGASSTADDVLNEPSSPFGTLSGDPVASPAKSSTSYPGGIPFFNMGGGKRGDMIEEIDEVELAVWWVPANNATQEMYLRRLEGEIHLAKDLQPTCRFLPFSVEYAVEMLPLVSDFFEPHLTGREKFLLIHPVEIATHHSEEGPMPTAYTKPLRDREREKRKKDKEKEKESMSMGILSVDSGLLYIQ